MPGLSILHVTTLLQGGAGRVVVDLACGQRLRGDRSWVACASQGAPGYVHYDRWLDRLREHGVPVVPVECTFRRGLHHLLGAVDGIERHPCCQSGIDVVHAHAAVPALVGRLLQGHPPVVATVHGWNEARTTDHTATDVGVLNRTTLVAVPSEAARRQLLDAGVDAERLRVVPYGIPLDVPPPMAQADADLLARWRSEGRLVGVCVGTVGQRKRQRLLLEALAVCASGSRIACAFIGEAPDLDAYARQAASCGLGGSVAFLGYRTQPAAWLSAAAFAVFPSAREGLPLALLEAAAHGVLPVVSDIPEHREVVIDGVSGLVFASTVNGLAAALDQVVAMPETSRIALGEGARAVWRHAHQPHAMTTSYDRLYATAIEQATRNRYQIAGNSAAPVGS